MPKESLSDREKAICQRISVAREIKGLTQESCSELTGIERSTLANYEAGFTPLSYDQAKRICYRLDINQRWLATGENPPIPYFDLSPNLEFSIKQNALFSKAFDDVLHEPINEQIDTVIQMVGRKAFMAGKYDNAVLNSIHLAGDTGETAGAFYVERVLKLELKWMPAPLQAEFQAELLMARNAFRKRHGELIATIIREVQKERAAMLSKVEGENYHLTDVIFKDNFQLVTPKLPNLLKRLNKASEQRGKKSALAKYLGVSLVQVSQWLSGDREPGGEKTLQLLNWVEQQERQK